MSSSKVQCRRCKKRRTSQQASTELWNMIMKQGVCVGHLCHDCQTTEENIEAEINLATTKYGVNAFGQIIGFPKIGETV